MSAFAAEHESAYADVQANGQAVTFTRDTVPYDSDTNTYGTPVTTSIAGVALKVKSDAQRYSTLRLDLVTMPTLLFVAETYALSAYGTAFVQAGDTCTWNGRDWTVKDVDPLAPDGTAIVARVVIGV